ncbi:DUF421 domain-containing protein [Robertmurraya sp. DFI.2.37]|jgi:uncharacterized membrane protein YcaP (DUF421 family)|uniref:DUF421 domain-containing protein n=1 Tax=Robertmurraya sp. DFI.2.37 TaxID=3031819 RepID=UPI0023DAEA6D|nr:DUF421 domain-containing protein [Robertmurraya sp. DFI.2.37]MDF1510218.1 DUF421 domain-containing protein [Robertmurraya sp. DFI.2.37]
MEILDLLKIIGRIITILPLLLMVTLIMGKRSIGELPVFDFLVIIVLGSVVGADIAEPKVNHIYTVISVVVIGLLQIFVSLLKIHNRRLGKLLTFEPTIVIHNGQFLLNNMQRIRYSIDNVLNMLRENNVFNVKDVELAIIEANGSLSVKLIHPKEPAKIENIHAIVPEQGIEIPVIIDGVINNDVLQSFNLDQAWLEKELEKKKITNINSVFYAAINHGKELHVSPKEHRSSEQIPIIQH